MQPKTMEQQLKDLTELNTRLTQENEDLKNLAEEQRRQSEERDLDPLTGIFAKDAFFRQAEAILKRSPKAKFAFMRFDIDRFQVINTLFGMEEGDRLLSYCASMLEAATASCRNSIVGRIDADIFGVICELDAPVEVKIGNFMKDVNEFLEGYRKDFRFNFSMGIYVIEDNDEPIGLIYSKAALASRQCKNLDGVYYAFFEDAMADDFMNFHRVIGEMHTALKNCEFEVYLQPKCSLKTGAIAGAEALVRWNHPERGILHPDEFIPAFEKSRFITKLDFYMLEIVCGYIRSWMDEGLTPVPVSINLSQVDFLIPTLARELRAIVRSYGIDEKYVHFEITESTYSKNRSRMIETLKELRDYGFMLEMDDFGRGYSSLHMIGELPIDAIKLDLNFLQSEGEEKGKANILQFIMGLARRLDLIVTAEGIETDDQLNFLNSIGCDYGQGYLFSKAVPKEEFDNILRDREVMVRPKYEQNTFSSLEMEDIWFPGSKFNLMFNIFVGGLAIMEYSEREFDKGLKIIRANEKFFDTVSNSPENKADLEKGIDSYIHPEDIEVLLSAVYAADKQNAAATTEFRLRDPQDREGYIWLRVNFRIIVRNKDSLIILASVEDITNEKNLAQQLKATEELYEDFKKQVSENGKADAAKQ